MDRSSQDMARDRHRSRGWCDAPGTMQTAGHRPIHRVVVATSLDSRCPSRETMEHGVPSDGSEIILVGLVPLLFLTSCFSDDGPASTPVADIGAAVSCVSGLRSGRHYRLRSGSCRCRGRCPVAGLQHCAGRGVLMVSEPDGSGGGDPLPRTPETRVFSFAPGTLTLACQPEGADPADSDLAKITVVDPGDYCVTPPSTPSVVRIGRAVPGCHLGLDCAWGVDALVMTLEGPTRDYSAREAQVGYLAATSRTWLAYRRGAPYMSISLVPDETGFTAHPGVLC